MQIGTMNRFRVIAAMTGTWNVEMTFWFPPGGPGLKPEWKAVEIKYARRAK